MYKILENGQRFEFEAAASRSKGRISERSEYNDVYNL